MRRHFLRTFSRASLITLITPEYHAAHFESAKTAFEKDGGVGVLATEPQPGMDRRESDDVEMAKNVDEKLDYSPTPALARKA